MNYGANLPAGDSGPIDNITGDAIKGMDSMGVSVNTVLAGITEMGGALDSLSKNPLMTYAFFEKVNNMWKHKYTDQVRDAKDMTDELKATTTQYLKVIERGSAILAAFTYNIGTSTIEMRKAGMEFQKFANQPQLGGTNGSIGSRYGYAGATSTMQYGSEFSGIRQQLFKEVAGRMGESNISQSAIDAIAAVQQTRGFNMGGVFSMYMGENQGVAGINSKSTIGLMMQIAESVDKGTFSRGDPSNMFQSIFTNALMYQSKGVAPDRSMDLSIMNARLFGDDTGENGEIRGLGLSTSKAADFGSKFALGTFDTSKRVMIERFLGKEVADRALGYGGGAYLADAFRDDLMGDPTKSKIYKVAGFNKDNISSFQTSRSTEALGENLANAAGFRELMQALNLSVGDIQTLINLRDITIDKTNALNRSTDRLSDTYDAMASGTHEYSKGKLGQIRDTRSIMDIVSGAYHGITTGTGDIGELLNDTLGLDPVDIQAMGLMIGGPLAKVGAGGVMRWMGRQAGILPAKSPSGGVVSSGGYTGAGGIKYPGTVPKVGMMSRIGSKIGGFGGLGMTAGVSAIQALGNFTNDKLTAGQAARETAIDVMQNLGMWVAVKGISAAVATFGGATVLASAIPLLVTSALVVADHSRAEEQYLKTSTGYKKGEIGSTQMGIDVRGYTNMLAGPAFIPYAQDWHKPKGKYDFLYTDGPVSPYRDQNFAPSSPFMSDKMNDIFMTHKGLDSPFDFDTDMKVKKSKEKSSESNSTLDVNFFMDGTPLSSTAISQGETRSIMINLGGVRTA